MANRRRTLHHEVFCITDMKVLLSKRLPKVYREFYNEGAMDLLTLTTHTIEGSNIDTSTTLFGAKLRFPFGFSPAACHKIAHPDGEIATSRAAADGNICMALSAYATCSLEEVIAQGGANPYIMQFSILKNRGITKQILQRAESGEVA